MTKPKFGDVYEWHGERNIGQRVMFITNATDDFDRAIGVNLTECGGDDLRTEEVGQIDRDWIHPRDKRWIHVDD